MEKTEFEKFLVADEIMLSEYKSNYDFCSLTNKRLVVERAGDITSIPFRQVNYFKTEAKTCKVGCNGLLVELIFETAKVTKDFYAVLADRVLTIGEMEKHR